MQLLNGQRVKLQMDIQSCRICKEDFPFQDDDIVALSLFLESKGRKKWTDKR